MTRNVTFVLCVAGLALGACYDHRTIEEADISPIEAQDAGTELPDDGDDGDDGDSNGGEGNGGANEGDGEGPPDPGGMGPFGDLDCENPPDRITELLCGLQEGGNSSGQGGGGFPGASGGQSGGSTGRPGGTTGGMGSTTGGGWGPTTGGGMGSTTGGSGMPSTPEEIIQEIIDNLDCEMDEPDFLTQILCALTGEGGGFPGGGFPGGGGGGGSNGFPF